MNGQGMAHPPELGLLSVSEEFNGGFIKGVFAEFVHMTAFLFFTIGTICSSCHIIDIGEFGSNSTPAALGDPLTCGLTQPRVLTIAMAFGFAIAVLVYSAATFSGGHLNPAVTFGLLVAKKISLVRAFLYWIAQICGAIFGSALVYAVDRSGWNAAGGGVNALSPGLSGASGWLLECLLTFALVFVVLAATDANRSLVTAHIPVLAPFAIGFTVFICHLVAIPLDGCSINPARSFGPAVISGTWKDMWVFWVGPFSGGALAALVYELCFRPSRSQIMAPGQISGGNVVSLPNYAGLQGALKVGDDDQEEGSPTSSAEREAREGATRV